MTDWKSINTKTNLSCADEFAESCLKEFELLQIKIWKGGAVSSTLGRSVKEDALSMDGTADIVLK